MPPAGPLRAAGAVLYDATLGALGATHQHVTSDGPDDAALVSAFLRGSEDAFGALYARHAPRMYGLARRLLGPHAGEADDVLQTAWMRASRRLQTFRGASSLSTWLCGFVVNCCRERAPGRLVSAEPPVPPPPAMRLDDPIDVHRALASLPDGYRAVLVLHDIEGHTHVEIARLLGIEPGTSKSQLSRARQAMRLRLTQGIPGER